MAMDEAMGTCVFSQEQHGSLIPYLAALHASCITVDRMVGPFLPPLTNEKLLAWWKDRITEANKGTRLIILLLPALQAGARPQGTDLMGLAMLKLSESETGSFRGYIDAVLVNQKYRRQGGAKALVAALEQEAGRRGRTLLVGILIFRRRTKQENEQKKKLESAWGGILQDRSPPFFPLPIALSVHG